MFHEYWISRPSLREKCSNTELFLVTIFPHLGCLRILRIQSECGKIRTRNNSVFGHFSRSAYLKDLISSEFFRRPPIEPGLTNTTYHDHIWCTWFHVSFLKVCFKVFDCHLLEAYLTDLISNYFLRMPPFGPCINTSNQQYV